MRLPTNEPSGLFLSAGRHPVHLSATRITRFNTRAVRTVNACHAAVVRFRFQYHHPPPPLCLFLAPSLPPPSPPPSPACAPPCCASGTGEQQGSQLASGRPAVRRWDGHSLLPAVAADAGSGALPAVARLPVAVHVINMRTTVYGLVDDLLIATTIAEMNGIFSAVRLMAVYGVHCTLQQ